MAMNRVFLALVACVFIGTSGRAREIDRDSLEQQAGETTARAAYAIIKDANGVTVHVKFSVSKAGTAGEGKGAMGLALIDEKGEVLFKTDRGLTVAAAKAQDFEKKITVDEARWNKVAAVGFRVLADSDKITVPGSPMEWRSALAWSIPTILAALDVGGSEEVKGWTIKKLK